MVNMKISVCFASFFIAFLNDCNAQKSFLTQDPESLYIDEHSFPLRKEQEQLLQETLKLPEGAMAGAPEVVRMNMLLMRMIKAKRVLDLGLFTGSSALGAALATPADGLIIGVDVNRSYWDDHGAKYAKQAGVEKKILVKTYPEDAGNKVLDGLIRQRRNGTFDFCFIDADKENYPNYFTKCKTLVRKGGIITIDNALWGSNPVNSAGKAIDETNDLVKKTSTWYTMLPIAQGLQIIYNL